MATGYIPALMRLAAPIALWLPLVVAAAEAPETEPAAALALTAAQQRAVGIAVAHPLPLSAAPQIEAYGTVLDPAALAADLGRLESTQAAAGAASADRARLERLYRAGEQASLKVLQASQAQAAEAAAQARAAAVSFSLQWGPLAGWSAQRERALLAALSKGQVMLLRADVPAQHLSSELSRRALVEVDGASLVAQVLGPLPRTDAQAQSSGWLLQLEHAPVGLGPGARTQVHLQASMALSGLLVPAAALLFAEQGAYVYRQTAGGTDTFHYDAVAVRPLARVGSAWLVAGLTRSDAVVVQGAGVLWSLQGISSFSAAEAEHD